MHTRRANLHRALLGRAAERIWTEGRANPIDWAVGTTLGAFRTADRLSWRTDDGAWTAELRRSRNGRRLYLVLFHQGVYLGSYEPSRGWVNASGRSLVRQLRSLPLPTTAA